MIQFLILLQFALQVGAVEQTPEAALQQFQIHSKKISAEKIRALPVTQNGRIKPFDTLARETVLFLSGSYSRWGLGPLQIYLGIATFESAPYVPAIEVRNVPLRTRIGYMKEKRFFSVAELESSNLYEIAQPLFRKQEEGGKLNEEEKAVTETVGQVETLKRMISGEHFARAVDFASLDRMAQPSEVGALALGYIRSLKTDPVSADLAMNLLSRAKQQSPPALFQHYMEKLDFEVIYNDLRIFFWSALGFLLFGIATFFAIVRNKLSRKLVTALSGLPLVFLVVGIGCRVYITQFAPVTNMYTTMLWVALGVSLFGILLFALYQNWNVLGFIMIGSGLILLLAEQIPLVLSPDLDPLVAVLRSNFWLSTHVTTITISYAAFTIAMILGNVALVRTWTHRENAKFFKEYAHYAYRMIQLGCFLLTVGIILGGIWADYSWGRFWGWDPKETWALIADLGFLLLLHARFVGWVDDFKLLAFSPIAYLLVIMAWYGVNFILATGLHSYGFSSGGATMVAVFVGLQSLLIAGSYAKYRLAP